MTKISIVVPIYNVEPYIAESLDSLAKQTEKDIEVICVDDGSTDRSVEIAQSYCSRDRRFQLIRQKNLGTVVARKRGVDKAKGEYILFVDPDDMLKLDACAKVYAFARQQRCDILQFGVDIIESGQRSEQQRAASEAYFNPVPREYRGKAILKACYLDRTFAHNVIFKLFDTQLVRKAFACIPDVYSINETDLYAFFYLAAYAKYYCSMPDRLYCYRYGNGISTRPFYSAEQFHRVLCKLDTLAALDDFVAGKLSGEPVADECRQEVRRRMIDNVCGMALFRLPEKALVREALDAIREKCGGRELVQALASRFETKPDDCAAWLQDVEAVKPCQPKRIRRVGLHYFHMTIGGIQTVVRELMNIFKAQGIVPVLFTEEKIGDKTIPLPTDLEIAYLPSSMGKAAVSVSARIEAFERALREHPVDVMYSHQHVSQTMLWDILVCKWIARIPFVLHYHNLFAVTMYVNPTARMFVNLANHLRMCDCVIALSRIDRDYFQSLGISAAYLPNPAQRGLSESLRRTDPPARNSKQVLWIGRVAWEKHPVDALYIFARVHAVDPETRLVVVGGGAKSIFEKMQSVISELGLTDAVEFAGSQNDPYRYYWESSLLLTTPAFEGFGMTSLEALAHGLPIVSYANEQLELYQSNSAVRQVREGDRVGAAEAILSILQDPDLEGLRQVARASVDKFLRFDTGAEIARIFEKLGTETPDLQRTVPLREVGIMMTLLCRGIAAVQQKNLDKINLLNWKIKSGAMADAKVPPDAAVRRYASLKRAYDEMQASVSFKIGRVLTWFPRTVRDMLFGGKKHRNK